MNLRRADIKIDEACELTVNLYILKRVVKSPKHTLFIAQLTGKKGRNMF